MNSDAVVQVRRYLLRARTSFVPRTLRGRHTSSGVPTAGTRILADRAETAGSLHGAERSLHGSQKKTLGSWMERSVAPEYAARAGKERLRPFCSSDPLKSALPPLVGAR